MLIRRKTAHLAGTMVLLVTYFSGLESGLIWIYSGALIYSVYELLKWSFGYESSKLSKAFKLVGSPEYDQNMPYGGPLYFGLGIILVVLLFRYPIACASIAILTVGDSIAAIVGALFGKTHLQINYKKSLEGSLAGFVSAFFVAMFYVPPAVAAVGAFVGMVFEALSTRVNDNLTIPISAALAMTMSSFFVVF